jgi:hypothetical protein
VVIATSGTRTPHRVCASCLGFPSDGITVYDGIASWQRSA